MYKLLLCWRYLRTRFLAMICIVSVMLGVATLIVVNSVMSGFSEKLRSKLHNLLADVVIESDGIEGFHDPEAKIRAIKADPFLADRVEALAASVECFAMMQFEYPNGQKLTRPVRLMGVDPEMRGDLGGFRDNLLDPAHRERKDFALPPEIEHFWRERDRTEREWHRLRQGEAAPPPAAPAIGQVKLLPPVLPPQGSAPDDLPPPAPPQDPDDFTPPPGVIVGNLIAGFRYT